MPEDDSDPWTAAARMIASGEEAITVLIWG
jgi:hypothetical protein